MTRMVRQSARGLSVAVATVLLLVVACTYAEHDDALSQRFTWFSYLNGDDIRARCSAASADRYRFVYNGIYVKQARTYDLAPAAAGTDYQLTARVLGPSDLSRVTLDPAALIDDPLQLLAPFAGVKRRTGLGPRDIDALVESLSRSGFFQPAPAGLYLHADDFFWIAVACVGGRVTFNAWRYPSAGFDALSFPALLFSWDPTGVAVNPPRDLSPFDIYGQAMPPDSAPRFTLTVGTDGLAGTGTVF